MWIGRKGFYTVQVGTCFKQGATARHPVLHRRISSDTDGIAGSCGCPGLSRYAAVAVNSGHIGALSNEAVAACALAAIYVQSHLGVSEN